MIVLHPDPYLLPCYRISPFQTKDMHLNNAFADSDVIDDYFATRFPQRTIQYVANGRAAIELALQQYDLQKDDVVTIFTSSGNFYISSCVTKEIEKCCRWSRKIETNTKLIFVNHEFGYPFPHLEELKKYQLPIIEDCCHSFFSTNAQSVHVYGKLPLAGEDTSQGYQPWSVPPPPTALNVQRQFEIQQNTMGNTGDFAIFSFPKMFPIQIGGLLVAKNELKAVPAETITAIRLRYIKNVLSHYIVQKNSFISTRIDNYRYLQQQLNKLDIAERCPLLPGVVPGVYLFRVKNEAIDLPTMKNHLQAHGIQCSVFYGEHSFFIPVHQNLIKPDLDFFVSAISSYLNS